MSQKPKVAFPFQDANLERLRTMANDLLRGRANVSGTFTLTANVGSTTITDPQFAADQVIVPVPTTANGAAEIGAGTMYLSARTNGTFTFTHANNAQTDRTFLYLRFG